MPLRRGSVLQYGMSPVSNMPLTPLIILIFFFKKHRDYRLLNFSLQNMWSKENR